MWWKRTLVFNTLVLHFIFHFVLLAYWGVYTCHTLPDIVYLILFLYQLLVFPAVLCETAFTVHIGRYKAPLPQTQGFISWSWIVMTALKYSHLQTSPPQPSREKWRHRGITRFPVKGLAELLLKVTTIVCKIVSMISCFVVGIEAAVWLVNQCSSQAGSRTYNWMENNILKKLKSTSYSFTVQPVQLLR